MIIEHKKLLGANGQPEAAQIPWDVFLAVQSQLEDDDAGDHFTEAEVEQILEASADLENGNIDVFVPLSEVKARFAEQ